jgi:DNA-binding GntR family transcriptional regulator
VADVGQSDMQAAYQARLVIEPGAARLAAAQRPAAPINRMRAAVSSQRRAVPNVRRSFDANREFHIALVQGSGNPFLIQFVQRLWVSRIGEVIYERQSETPERMALDADEHEQILSAIEDGNGRRAESLTRRHLAEAMQRSADLLR